ncbi:MAG: hypothetical protein ACLR8Y_08785 [Alistipes indistinctus]
MIFTLRIGERYEGEKAKLNNVDYLERVCRSSANGKPDAELQYEGPVEDLPRNILPGQHHRPSGTVRNQRDAEKRYDRHRAAATPTTRESGHRTRNR